jgi:UDP-glucose 4-epimerase
VRIVVTGATGNVGSALLRQLVDAGEHDIVGLARRLPTDAGPPFDAVAWRSVDLTDDSASPVLREVFADADAVVHLAWGFQPSHDPGYLEELGVGGTRRVLDAVAAADVPHLVHMSSVGAYSPKRDDRPVDESWPTGGVPTSPYSRHKSQAERLLDAHERAHPDRVVTRVRPGIVGQRTAGSALLRYGLPGVVPAGVIAHVPVLPLDRRLTIPMVHSDDVARAFRIVLEARAPGAFNLAAEPSVTTVAIAGVLGARSVHVPSSVLRALVSASWHARLQPVDPGWLDLGFAVPLMDTGRARRELGWTPQVDALAVLAETVSGMRDAASDRSPVLRPRSVAGQLARALRRGPVSRRQEP